MSLKMKYCMIFILVFCFRPVYLMNEAQMKATGNLMRSVCQPKFKVTDAQIDEMHKGIFNDVENQKCYYRCVLTMLKSLKNDKFDYDATKVQIKTLPPRYQQPTYVVLDKCKDSVQSSGCEAGYELAKCMYFADPEYYFLP